MDDLITRKQHKDFAAKVDERLDALEAAKITALNITLSDSGWTENSGDTDYPYRYVLTVTGELPPPELTLSLMTAALLSVPPQVCTIAPRRGLVPSFSNRQPCRAQT